MFIFNKIEFNLLRLLLVCFIKFGQKKMCKVSDNAYTGDKFCFQSKSGGIFCL